MATQPALLDEFEYYLAHQDEMVAQYDGQVIALKGHEVIGVYPDERTAHVEAGKTHEPGTFIIQRVSPGEKDYTATFHSRVVLP